MHSTSLTDPPHASRFSRWFVVGLLFIAGAFAYLEISQPFYFTQDDALTANLPGTIEGCRSVWKGVWPDYDPCRLMGGPLAATGMFSITYPPTFVCYAFARHILRNEFATFEVFAAAHILCGYIATYWLCHRRGIRPMIACCCALSFVLSGSTLIMGRSWPYYLAVVVWLPLLVAAVDRLREDDVGLSWVLIIGILSGALYHVGFPQLWVYAMLLLGFAVLWMLCFSRINWRRALLAMAGAIVGLGIAAPLLTAQMTVVSGVARPPVYGDGITYHWLAAFLPYPLKIPHPMGWGSVDTQYMGHFIFFGGVFAVLFVFSVVVTVTTRPLRRSLGENVWIAAGVAALLLNMGRYGGIYNILSQIPLLRTVNNHPFRALPFFVLFAVYGSSVVVEAKLRERPGLRRSPPALAILTLVLLAYHVVMARPSFYTYGYGPYPPIAPAILKQHLQGKTAARIMSWVPLRSISPTLAAALPQDLPMVYDLPAFSGYDPLLEYGTAYTEASRLLDADPLAACRAYGIRWHLLSPLITHPILSPNVVQNVLEQTVPHLEAAQAIRPALTVVVKRDDVRLAELSDVAPMAFPEQRPVLYLPITADGHGLAVQLTRWRGGGNIVVNYLWYPQLRASVDGKRVSVAHDTWQRIVVRVPAGAKTLEITYAAGWGKGLAVGMVLSLVGALGGLVLNRSRTTTP